LTIPQIDPGTRALRDAISASIAPMAWCLAGLYGLLAVIHPFILSGDQRLVMAVVAAVSSALSAAVALTWRKNPRPDRAHLINFLLAGIALVNTVLHFALFQEAVNTTNFVILILGLGLVMLSRVSFYSIVALALIAWTTIVTAFDVPDPSEWGWFLFFAAFVGAILEEQRIHATRASGVREELLLTLEGQARKAEHLESLGVLAGGVAHDFNNLLMVILGNIELLQESQTTSNDAQTRLKSMQQAGVRARDLAQKMLAYAGRAHRKTQTVDLAFFGSEIDSDWARDLLDGIDVVFDIDQSTVFPAEVDPTQIRQVVLNLLTNARDAGATQITLAVGSESALKLSEHISTLEGSGYHWLEVRDNGSGMPESEIERIFEPFYTTRKMGTGLGLAASRGIMHAHLGDLTVESKLEEGSQFRMLLPRSSKQPEPILNEAHGLLKTVSEKTKVLLIEDEALIAELTIAMLEQSGRQVQWLESLAAFQRDLPSIDFDQFEFALIDVTLSDGSGIDAATMIRKRRPNLPVILASGSDARNVLDDHRLDDSVEFLSKPFARVTLQTSIENAIARAEQLKTEKNSS
jgi:signal transduction histidine kinase/ActR/RegA family two-component response regulator